jgi:F-type H+-transporting ATPase subunit epsilon
MLTMHVVISKVDEVLYEGEAESLTVPGSAGEMTILTHHEPLVTTLKAGELRLRVSKDAEPRKFPIEGGVLEVNENGATVIL